jgi:hypothetical protein
MGYNRPPGTNDGQTEDTTYWEERQPSDGAAPQRGRSAVGQERPDLGVDPGDSHDKGELSLCVGEAA